MKRGGKVARWLWSCRLGESRYLGEIDRRGDLDLRGLKDLSRDLDLLILRALAYMDDGSSSTVLWRAQS